MKNPKLVPHFGKPKDSSSRSNIISTSHPPSPPPCYLTHMLFSPHYSLYLSHCDLFTDPQTSAPWCWSTHFLGCFSLSHMVQPLFPSGLDSMVIFPGVPLPLLKAQSLSSPTIEILLCFIFLHCPFQLIA